MLGCNNITYLKSLQKDIFKLCFYLQTHNQLIQNIPFKNWCLVHETEVIKLDGVMEAQLYTFTQKQMTISFVTFMIYTLYHNEAI